MLKELSCGVGGDFGTTVLPSQYYDLVTRRNQLEGGLKLMLAVLEDGIRCYVKYRNARTFERRRIYREVRNWIADHSASQGVFGFENVCAALSINPDFMRRRIRRMEPRDLPTARYRRVAPSIRRRRLAVHVIGRSNARGSRKGNLAGATTAGGGGREWMSKLSAAP